MMREEGLLAAVCMRQVTTISSKMTRVVILITLQSIDTRLQEEIALEKNLTRRQENSPVGLLLKSLLSIWSTMRSVF